MLLFAGLLAGDAGGDRPKGCLFWVRDRTEATGFLVGVDFAGTLVCDTLGSAALVVVEHLEAVLSFTGAVGRGVFLASAAVVAARGLFATVAEVGRLTSFLAATVLGGCAAVVLPVGGAVLTLEAAVLAAAVVGGFSAAVVGLDVVDAGRDVEGAVVGLVVFETTEATGFVVAPTAFDVVEVLGFEAVEAAALLAGAVVLGLATVSATGLFLGTPFTVVGLVPFVAVDAAAEVVLAGPTGFLSGALDRVLTVEEAAAPTGRLGPPPAADAAFVVVAVFLAAAAETFAEDLTLFTVRCEEVPGLDPEGPADLAAGCVLVETPFGLTLESAATGLPLPLGMVSGATSMAASSGCDGASSVVLSCNEEGSATAASSVGSVVSMVSPSGFIFPPLQKKKKGVDAEVAAYKVQGPTHTLFD